MRTRTACLLAAMAVAGCGDIIGLGGYTDQVDGSVDSSGSEAGGGDAQPDVKSDVVVADAGDGGDAAPFPPSCSGASVCVPDLPSGWSWAAYAPDSRVACATGYATPTDVEEDIDAGAAACGCGCTTTNPSCTTGSVTITAGTNGTCDNITNQTDPATAGCNTLTQFGTSSGSSLAVIGPAPSGGSCTAVPSQTLPPVGYAHQGRTCGFTGTPGDAGCGDAGVCVPDPAPFTMCVSQAGVNACPSGFPTQHLVGTSTVDTRGCSPCGCTFDAGACVGTATLYGNTGCTFGAQAIPADGTCTAVNGNRTWRGYAYTPTSNTASCAGTAVSADGGVVFSDLTTVCCK